MKLFRVHNDYVGYQRAVMVGTAFDGSAWADGAAVASVPVVRMTERGRLPDLDVILPRVLLARRDIAELVCSQYSEIRRIDVESMVPKTYVLLAPALKAVIELDEKSSQVRRLLDGDIFDVTKWVLKKPLCDYGLFFHIRPSSIFVSESLSNILVRERAGGVSFEEIELR